MFRSSSAPAPGRARLRDALHRAVWRWHFYAGLVCLPFLILLSVTGSVYLFKDEINRTLFSHRTLVAVRATPPLSPERLVFIAAEAVPDARPTTYASPRRPTAPRSSPWRARRERPSSISTPMTVPCSTGSGAPTRR